MIQCSLKQACLGKGGDFAAQSLVQEAQINTSQVDEALLTVAKNNENIQDATVTVTSIIKQDYPRNDANVQDELLSPRLLKSENVEGDFQPCQANQQDNFSTPNASLSNDCLGNFQGVGSNQSSMIQGQVSDSSSLSSDIQNKLNIDTLGRTVSYQQQASSNKDQACRVVVASDSPPSSSGSDHSKRTAAASGYVSSDAFLNFRGGMVDSLHCPHSQDIQQSLEHGSGQDALVTASITSMYPSLQGVIGQQQQNGASPLTTQVSNSRSSNSSGKYEYESNVQMNQLLRMGFCDRPRNARLLAKHNNNVEKVVEDLVEEICSDSWFNNFV